MKEKINNWLISLEQKEQIPEDIVALNIGMYETENGYCLYLCGATHYDENNDDWACDMDYQAEDAYLSLPSESGWNSFLNQVADVLRHYVEAHTGHTLFDNRILTIGFDDGDLIRIR